MSVTTTHSLMQEFGLHTLTEEYRRRLVHELVDSLNTGFEQDDIVLTDEVKAELRRRAKDADEHPEMLLSWEEVKKQLLEEGDD